MNQLTHQQVASRRRLPVHVFQAVMRDLSRMSWEFGTSDIERVAKNYGWHHVNGEVWQTDVEHETQHFTAETFKQIAIKHPLRVIDLIVNENSQHATWAVEALEHIKDISSYSGRVIPLLSVANTFGVDKEVIKEARKRISKLTGLCEEDDE